MLTRLKRKFKFFTMRLYSIPKLYILILALMLFGALIIRLSVGGTHLIYNALRDRGIFPGPVTYCIFYVLRVILFSCVLYFSLYTFKLYSERIVCILLTLSAAVLVLLEYKMIFGGVSLLLAMLFAVLSGFFCVLTVIMIRVKSKWISVAALAFAFMQLIHFIQLISLSVCI